MTGKMYYIKSIIAIFSIVMLQLYRAICLTNATNELFPNITRLLCYPHIALTALPRNRDKLSNKNYFDIASSHIQLMHNCRSYDQFLLIAYCVIEKWERNKEFALAEWFQLEYLTLPHDKFCYSAASVHGVCPNNNPIEVLIFTYSLYIYLTIY